MSYYPKIFYKYGRQDMGYHYLKELYANERQDYPEVASGVIRGIVCGLAGVDADVTANRITTASALYGCYPLDFDRKYSCILRKNIYLASICRK